MFAHLLWRLVIWGSAIAASYVARFGLLLISSGAGDLGFWLGTLVLVSCTYWLCSAIPRRLAILGAVLGGVVSLVYFQIEWAFDRIILVDVLHRYTEDSIKWVGTGLGVVKWPIVLACVVAGFVSSHLAGPTGRGESDA